MLYILLLVFAIYFLINKLTPNFAGYLSDLKTAQFFIAILIGLGAIIAICLAVILLFIIRIGSSVALVLLLLFISYFVMDKFPLSLFFILNMFFIDSLFLFRFHFLADFPFF